MPNRSRRRPPPRRQRGQRPENDIQDRAVDAAARSLLSTRDAGQLRSELHDRELLLAEADQLAQTDPSPVNLARYREARSMVDVARKALQMATQD
jgi:hypothetical protein